MINSSDELVFTGIVQFGQPPFATTSVKNTKRADQRSGICENIFNGLVEGFEHRAEQVEVICYSSLSKLPLDFFLVGKRQLTTVLRAHIKAGRSILVVSAPIDFVSIQRNEELSLIIVCMAISCRMYLHPTDSFRSKTSFNDLL